MTPDTPGERYALIAWYMAAGAALSTRDVARLTGLKMRGAFGLMCCISRVLPIYQDERRIWRITGTGSADCRDRIAT